MNELREAGQLPLPQLMEHRAEQQPDEVFYQHVDGDRLTYSEFHRRTLSWAAAFQQIGVCPGETVVTMLPVSAEAHQAWLGLAWLGAIEVPANHDYRGRMLSYVIAQSESRFVVVPGRLVDRLVAVADELDPKLTVVVPDTDDIGPVPLRVLTRSAFFDAPDQLLDRGAPGFHDVSCILYTSGTTGPSKGVLVPWRQLLHTATAPPEDALGQGEGYYSFWPPFHASGKCALYLPAVERGRLVARDVFSSSAFWSEIHDFDCTFALVSAPLVHFLMAQPSGAAERDHPLRGIWTSPLSPTITEFGERFGVKISTAFGMTEIGTPIASDGWDTENWRSCGRVRSGAPGFELRIVDEHDEPIPAGQVGELVIRTQEPWALNAGYYGMPEQTARAWRNGWFHTGDGFSTDEDGYFYFIDRLKDCIRRRGENISSFEVERYVLECKDVAECTAVGIPSEYSEEEVKICIVRRPGSTLAADDLFTFLAPRMPRFMLPRFVEFVDALPKTDATLRVRKVVLREDARNANTWDREAAGVSVPGR